MHALQRTRAVQLLQTAVRRLLAIAFCKEAIRQSGASFLLQQGIRRMLVMVPYRRARACDLLQLAVRRMLSQSAFVLWREQMRASTLLQTTARRLIAMNAHRSQMACLVLQMGLKRYMAWHTYREMVAEVIREQKQIELARMLERERKKGQAEAEAEAAEAERLKAERRAAEEAREQRVRELREQQRTAEQRARASAERDALERKAALKQKWIEDAASREAARHEAQELARQEAAKEAALEAERSKWKQVLTATLTEMMQQIHDRRGIFGGECSSKDSSPVDTPCMSPSSSRPSSSCAAVHPPLSSGWPFSTEARPGTAGPTTTSGARLLPELSSAAGMKSVAAHRPSTTSSPGQRARPVSTSPPGSLTNLVRARRSTGTLLADSRNRMRLDFEGSAPEQLTSPVPRSALTSLQPTDAKRESLPAIASKPPLPSLSRIEGTRSSTPADSQASQLSTVRRSGDRFVRPITPADSLTSEPEAPAFAPASGTEIYKNSNLRRPTDLAKAGVDANTCTNTATVKQASKRAGRASLPPSLPSKNLATAERNEAERAAAAKAAADAAAAAAVAAKTAADAAAQRIQERKASSNVKPVKLGYWASVLSSSVSGTYRAGDVRRKSKA